MSEFDLSKIKEFYNRIPEICLKYGHLMMHGIHIHIMN